MKNFRVKATVVKDLNDEYLVLLSFEFYTKTEKEARRRIKKIDKVARQK